MRASTAGTWPSDWPEDAALPVQAYRLTMAAGGVQRGVLVTTVRAYGFDNRYAVDAARADPARFTSVGNLDVLAPGAPDRLTRWVEERGMRGVRFYGGDSADAADWLDDPRAEAAWRRAARLGVVVSAQRTRMTTLPALSTMLDRYPEVPTVVYSMGDPPLAAGDPAFSAAEPLLAMARFPRLYLNLSMANLDAAPSAFLEVLTERFGPERIMWGSYSFLRGARAGTANAPSLGETAGRVREAFAFLSSTERDRVLGGTAWSLYWPAEGSSRRRPSTKGPR